MRFSRIVTPIALASLFALVHADPPPNEARRLGEAALKDREWDKAEKLLFEAMATATEGKDEILAMIATAQQNAGKHDAAIGTLDKLLAEHPASALRMKAHFRKGDALAAKKEFALAAKIYEAQVAALTTEERRRKIAMVYVVAGREFLVSKDAKDPTFVANYQAARNLLTKALELEALGADEEGVRADVLVCEQKAGMDRAALLKGCREFLEKWPKSGRLDEVLFAHGVAYRDTGRWFDAKAAWLRIAAETPASKLAGEALYGAALLHVQENGNAAGIEDLRRALPLLRRCAKEFPATEWGPKAGFLAGLALAATPDLREEARKELLGFADAFAKDERAPEALLRVAWLWRADGDDARAIATFEDFLRRFPDSPRWTEVRQSIADVRFEAVQRTFLRKDWASARTAATEFTTLHPTDGRAALMTYRVGEGFREEKKWKESVEAWMRCASKYPGYNEGHQARFEAAKIMASELGDFETAIKELQKVGGSWNGHAQEFLRTLQGKALALKSEKVFTGADTPAVKLTVRNVETVKLRVWTLDLKDYFEKKASTSGLEALEVSVIAPDKEWEVPVKDYQRFKEFALDIELPKKEPGAYVIAASAGALESKTVVLVSDLAMIARAGRQGATVLVQNMRTGERVETATIRTAADGKHLRSWTSETKAGRLGFLAEAGGHLAFRDLDVSGMPLVPERKPNVQFVTDRVRYAAGDEVTVRLVVRDAVEGAYAVPKDKTYRLAAFSAQGIEFHDQAVTVSKAGTAVASLRLPKGLGGGFVLRIFEAAKPAETLITERSFSILGAEERFVEFEALVDDTPRWIGDEFEIVTVLRDAWGRPLPNRRVQMMGGHDVEWKDVMTDAGGRFTVAFKETERWFRDGVATMRVRADGVEDLIAVPVLQRTPVLTLEAESRVTEPVFAGEQKTFVFTAKGADDKPFAGSFTWTVVRTDLAGQPAAVANGTVTTDAEGKGRFAFTPNQAGIHTATIVMRDADGLPTRLQTAVQVLDDTDERKLRLASGADEFEPGQPFELAIVSRVDKGLAYVTVEGEKVEQVVPVTLARGRTTVKLAAPPAGNGTFTVAVMMMDGDKFQVDVRDFGIKRPEVKVDVAKKEVKPGEELSVSVTAKPGSEVWLMAAPDLWEGVDEDAFRPLKAPGGHFRADSSVGTTFAWGTQQIDEELLSALAQLDELQSNAAPRVMMEKKLDRFKDKAGEADRGDFEESELGGGGGGGGRYGGRMGGKRNLVARGGGGQGRIWAQRAPAVFAKAEADATGKATFKFAAPSRREDLDLVAWSIDGGNAIGRGEATVKVRGTVFSEARLPASAVAGEATQAIVFITNTSAAEVEVAVALDGTESKVKVPARSIVEQAIPWKASASATVTVDGVKHALTCALRSAAPSTVVEAGGAFTAKTDLKLEGQGATRIRVATGPAALLDSLAEGSDPLTPASDAAARLIAKIARHRFEKTDATRDAVREFAALRAQGLSDAAGEDIAGHVLLYLAAAEAHAAEFEIEADPSVLRKRFAQSPSDDSKALILCALARGGHADYGFVFRLLRAADTLSPRAQAALALALKAAKKDDEAKAAIARLEKAVQGGDHWDAGTVNQADSANTAYVTTALAAFAMAEIDPANALLPKARTWLLARRPATPFERAALALAMQSTPDRSTVTSVTVDGQEIKGFGEVVATAGSVSPSGAGTFYAVAWRETGKAPEPAVKVTVARTALWPGLVTEGRLTPATNAAVKEPVENPSMAKVAAGESFLVKYELTVAGPTTQYSVYELPPATGLRIDPKALRILIPPQTEAERKLTVHVTAYADAPGTYPEISVLAPGAAYRDGWQMTHGERVTAGAVYFELKKWKECRDVLVPLFEKGTLHDPVAAETARELAYSGIELGENPVIVKFFEILKEKSPGTVVPFDKIKALARAYAAVNEHERAMQVSSGACDAYFLQEAQLAGALEDLGRMKDAVGWMKTLLAEYPDTSLNREMLFGFGQRLYSRGTSHKEPATKDEKALKRAELLAEAATAFETVLGWFPSNDENDRVMLSLCSAYLEAGKHDAADASARAAAVRYPKSRYLDTFDYTQAFSLFAQRKYAEAISLCDRLESHDYGPKANPGPGIIRTQAVLMKAQIFHAKGELDKAIENYKKVREKSQDAERSIAFLEREALALPDVTLAPLAKAAELELEYAGVAEAHVKAYKVDLTMLALRRKNIVDASSVEVAGIKPVFEKTVKLDHPNARRREKQSFTLDLKEPGAYLVGVKAGDFFASGIILRSNLTMGVQEETSGTVRVNISDVAGGGFAEGVKVTIFGTDESKIASDKTDLRGIWETAGVRGLAVVVAEKDGHYAMYRGQAALGMIEQTRNRPPSAPEMSKNLQEQQKEMLDAELRDANDALEDSYKRNVRKQQQGVEVERMKK